PADLRARPTGLAVEQVEKRIAEDADVRTEAVPSCEVNRQAVGADVSCLHRRDAAYSDGNRDSSKRRRPCEHAPAEHASREYERYEAGDEQQLVRRDPRCRHERERGPQERVYPAAVGHEIEESAEHA